LVKILKFFDVDLGWKKFGSGINIPDPQQCRHGSILILLSGSGSALIQKAFSSVADPDLNPDPPDPLVFGPPRSFYHQAKKVRKTLITTALCLLFDFLSLKMMYGTCTSKK
jgi:hypothetical protein